MGYSMPNPYLCYILPLDWAVNQVMNLSKYVEEQRKQVDIRK